MNVTRYCLLKLNQTLRNKLQGQMHYTIGASCVINGHEIYTLLL